MTEEGADADYYGIEPSVLAELNSDKDDAARESFGGVTGFARLLKTDLHKGLSTSLAGPGSIEHRRRTFGENRFQQLPLRPFLLLLWDNLRDPILILLAAAAVVSTTIGAAVKEERDKQAWVEGVAIWVAIIVVSGVASFNDWQKGRQFQKLNAVKDLVEVKVIRDGKESLVPNTELVVGDLTVIDTGDKLAADMLVVEVQGLVVDEAPLTGESEPIRKGPARPWLRCGTQVSEGSGRGLVLAVGEKSEWGQTMSLVAVDPQATPLQESLTVLAAAIGKIGLTVGVLCFIVLMIRWMVENKGFPADQIREGPLKYFIFAVTIVVVAVPEGLPLAVTISLAYSMKKMMKDNNFVRVLAACETMGGATTICSDKTGTLTENRMTVISGWVAGSFYAALTEGMDLPHAVLPHLTLNISINSKAFLIEHGEGEAVEFVGNRTECALLMLLRRLGVDYSAIREEQREHVAHLFGFSSEKKMASVLLTDVEGRYRLYNKGAAEIVLARCTAVLDAEGNSSPLTPELRTELEAKITEMASTGLRTLCLSFREVGEEVGAKMSDPEAHSEDSDLTAYAIFGIKDPVRAEVPEAVRTCQRAGITVRMVTGDNIYTAQHIARECGILTPEGIALEGPHFRKLTPEQLAPLLPKLQVLARSSPQDKFTLVKALKKAGEIVAVTGDGTNDAPALKESHVGLAMGITGTEVAKEAADIVILDDNFRSIVKSVSWGRSVYENLRKFLVFQLTINGVALVVAFIAAVTTGQQPLTVLQLLWVNLIMDALAALALATESPTPELLLDKPHGRTEPLINGRMWKHILVQALYQCFWLFLIFYGAPAQIARYQVDHQGKAHLTSSSEQADTLVFNLFIFCQIFNIFNSRKAINDEINIFKGLKGSRTFLYITGIIIVLQLVIMLTPTRSIFNCVSQSPAEWAVAVAAGAGSLPLALLTKLTSRWLRRKGYAEPMERWAVEAGQATAKPFLAAGHASAVPFHLARESVRGWARKSKKGGEGTELVGNGAVMEETVPAGEASIAPAKADNPAPHMAEPHGQGPTEV